MSQQVAMLLLWQPRLLPAPPPAAPRASKLKKKKSRPEKMPFDGREEVMLIAQRTASKEWSVSFAGSMKRRVKAKSLICLREE